MSEKVNPGYARLARAIVGQVSVIPPEQEQIPLELGEKTVNGEPSKDGVVTITGVGSSATANV